MVMRLCLLFLLFAGVCIRLKDLIDRLFPKRSKERRREVEEEEKGEPTALTAVMVVHQPLCQVAADQGPQCMFPGVVSTRAAL